MLTLKKYFDRFDERDRQLEEYRTSYLSALQGIEETAVPVSDHLVEHHRKVIRKLRLAVAEELPSDRLPEVRAQLNDELRHFSQEARQVLDTKDREIRRILQCLSEAAHVVAEQSHSNNSRLTQFTRNLDALKDLHDLPTIRERLNREVQELKNAVREIHANSGETVVALQSELATFQKRLAEIEQLAMTDELTRLPNRRAGEEAIRRLIADGRTFSILMYDIDRFKSINDRWGHAAGDAVLVGFSQRLQAAVRSGDIVFRWGGDEFVVILPHCEQQTAEDRAGHIEKHCRGPFLVRTESEEVSLHVSAAVGIGEYSAGDTAERLFQKADQQLYRKKSRAMAAR